jgi:lysophospholipase L1-like esterase
VTRIVADEVGSFLALGDSFTEGMHDEVDASGHHRGWADRVAETLAVDRPDLRYGNLAIRGRLLDQVVAEQVPIALQVRPDLISFHAGANDLLRPGGDVAGLLYRYDLAVKRLRATGAEVLLFTVIERAGGTGALADALARHFQVFNASVRATARRRGALLADIGGEAALHDRRLWHEDRLHLAPDGHARVAAAVLEVLGVRDPARLGGAPGWWREPLPTPPRAGRREVLASDLSWARRHLAPWIGRRLRGASSGDGRVCKRPDLEPVCQRTDDAELIRAER